MDQQSGESSVQFQCNKNRIRSQCDQCVDEDDREDTEETNHIEKEQIKMNIQKIKDKMRLVDWSTLYESRDINIINDILENKILEVYDAEAPLKKVQVRRNHCNWIGDKLKNLMKDRDKFRERARLSCDNDEWGRYRRLRNQVT